MRNYWISWIHCIEIMGKFELHSPWWISGSIWFGEQDTEADTICAAIKAFSEEDALELIYKCYDIRPEEIEFRFCNERNSDWQPFSDRFPRAKWMKWDA